jgi:hypothetical protein
MADKYESPQMEWTQGDVGKRFDLFKQKCQLIFQGPLAGKGEQYKARMLLLWVGDKGLEIYNAARFEAEEDKLKTDKIFEKLGEYAKPLSNHILARFRLRGLKQGELNLEEFITQARTLIDESNYPQNTQTEMLRDALVFGLKSDKVRQEAIAKGNDLTYDQVYQLAKTYENTENQMRVMNAGTEPKEHVLAVRRTGPVQSHIHVKENQGRYKDKNSRPRRDNTRKCLRCGDAHDNSAYCRAASVICNYCKVKGHYEKVCIKKRNKVLHQIRDDPSYSEQDIFVESETDDGETHTITTNQKVKKLQVLVEHGQPKYATKIYAKVKVNNVFLKMKVDTGAETSVVNKNDLRKLKDMGAQKSISLESSRSNCHSETNQSRPSSQLSMPLVALPY